MSTPTIFLSAASVDLREWRDVLDAAFRRGGFRVLTQDKSLGSAPGNVRRLLTETIAESDCVIHLAGLGYGSDATDPFPQEPAFQCSWTQFEYYHAHHENKDVIAFVCAPQLSKTGFAETGKDATDIARKQRLQAEHRQRVEKGTFENTPLPNAPQNRTSNESVGSIPDLLAAVAAAVGKLHKLDRDACEKAQQELRGLAEVVARIEAGVGSAIDKLDRILSLLRPPAAAPPFQLPPPASAYFGRATLIADLTARLRKDKRTDVWGGPGMGKTALAAAAVGGIVGTHPATLAASPFPDGVVYLDLYLHKGSTDTAWHALANAFDDSLPTDMKAADRATRACAHRHALVILEGAEELGTRLTEFIAVLAPESTLLVLTREEAQTAAGRRVKLNELLPADDALGLLRHLAGPDVPESILSAVQRQLGGHPLALTWAGSQLGDATQPPAHFLRDLEAQPFKKLTEPGGKAEHTLRWMFDRSVRLMGETTRIVLPAAARISEPFDADFAQISGGEESDLQRLVQLSFLRVGGEGWEFSHALAAQYARELPLPGGLLEKLGRWATAGIGTADARCHRDGPVPLGLALAHATALLAHDKTGHALEPLVVRLMDDGENSDTLGIRRGRLDFARRALDAVSLWHEQAPAELVASKGWQRRSSVALSRLGDLAVAQGDLPAAARSFSHARDIAQRLADSDPANAAWQCDLSVSLIKLGELAVAQGDLPAASRSLSQARDIAQRLAASDPANAAWQRYLSISLEKLGDLAVPQGDLPAASRYFSHARDIRVRLAASDPANAAWQRDLSYSLTVVAQVLMKQELWDQALTLMEQSLVIDERLASSDPTNVMWQRDVLVSRRMVEQLRNAAGK